MVNTMNITIRQLEILQQCVNSLHFTKAAQALHMTPAAVSKQINNLEEQLGFKLFEVVGKKVHITSQCNYLLPYVNKVLAEMKNLKNIAANTVATKAKPIKVSMGPGLESILFKSIHSFKDLYPNIEFQIIINHDRPIQLQDLLNNKTNIYFSSKFYKDKRIEQHKAFSLDLYLVCSSENNLARETVTQNKLKQQCFISTIPEKDLAKGYSSSLYLDSYMSVKQAIIADLGIGFLPSNLIRGENRITVLTQQPSLTKNIYLAHRKQQQHNELYAFIDYILHQANNLQ